MPTAQSNRNITFSGAPAFAEQTAQISAEHSALWEIDLPAVSALNTGTLTTRTDDDEGVVTLQTGHTIVSSGALVDLYWAGGSRHGMSATKDVNAITLAAGGTGDVLPAEDTAITMCAQLAIDPILIDGDSVEWIAAVYSNPLDTTAKAYLDLHDSGGSEKTYDLVHSAQIGGCGNVANVSGGDTCPIAGDSITDGYASHTSASAAKLYLMVLVDPTA
jgi:hypothetical protein